MYALSTSDEGDCYLYVPPDSGIEAAALGAGEAAALGASASAAPGAGESALLGTASAQRPLTAPRSPLEAPLAPGTESTAALHTFTLDSGASRCFFRDRTALEPLARPVAVSLADPSGGPVIATSSTVLPYPAVPSGTLSGLHLPSFSTNLVAGCALQDGGVHQFTPAYERVTHCTCARTGRHLATFTRQPGSDLYTLTTGSPQVAASASASATSSTVLPCPAVPSGTLSGLHLPSFSTNLVAGCALQDGGVHQFTPAYERVTHCTCARTGRHLATFTWQPGSDLYTLTTGSPQVAASTSASASGQLFAMHSRYLVSGLPRVLPPLPPSPAPPCLPCVEGRQRAAPHSSSFPPTTAPLQTLHMDVWGPARVSGQGQERYFLIVVDDYSCYTTVFPLHTKGESHMVQQVLQRFDFTYFSPQATPLSTRHSLSALPSDESVEPSGPYPELVGCLMYLMTCTRPYLAYPLSILARYVAPGRHRPEHMAAAKRVLRYLCSTSGLGLVLEG
ncbi:unnamed protein product [Closterium sp. NIES-54]